ncbi:MAG: hypothetical protein WA459_12960 [Stellaceae bacterium]
MPSYALLLALGLACCTAFDTDQAAAPGLGEVSGWQLASGKAPSRAEYAAMVAACQDGAVRHAAATPLDSCLADLGLKRAQ